MAKFRKLLLQRGDYCSRSGDWVHADDARMSRWAQVFADLRKRGIRFPLAYGHNPFAEPDDPDADPDDPHVRGRREYMSSALNAGFIEGLDYDPKTGDLYLDGDCPGGEVDKDGNLLVWTKLADGRQVRSALGEVSIGLNRWRSGKGETFEDIPVHVALCVLPVAENQTGFKALATRNAAPAAQPTTGQRQSGGPLYLSLLMLLPEKPMKLSTEAPAAETKFSYAEHAKPTKHEASGATIPVAHDIPHAERMGAYAHHLEQAQHHAKRGEIGRSTAHFDAAAHHWHAFKKGASKAAIQAEFTRHQRPAQLATDASGHEHKGKGPGGGQFTASSEAADASTKVPSTFSYPGQYARHSAESALMWANGSHPAAQRHDAQHAKEAAGYHHNEAAKQHRLAAEELRNPSKFADHVHDAHEIASAHEHAADLHERASAALSKPPEEPAKPEAKAESTAKEVHALYESVNAKKMSAEQIGKTKAGFLKEIRRVVHNRRGGVLRSELIDRQPNFGAGKTEQEHGKLLSTATTVRQSSEAAFLLGQLSHI
jgi:hypothetical protein